MWKVQQSSVSQPVGRNPKVGFGAVLTGLCGQFPLKKRKQIFYFGGHTIHFNSLLDMLQSGLAVSFEGITLGHDFIIRKQMRVLRLHHCNRASIVGGGC